MTVRYEISTDGKFWEGISEDALRERLFADMFPGIDDTIQALEDELKEVQKRLDEARAEKDKRMRKVSEAIQRLRDEGEVKPSGTYYAHYRVTRQ